MSPFPDPSQLLAIADRIGEHARAARTQAARVGSDVAAVDWSGTAADAFTTQALIVINGLRGAAARLDDAADALRRHARSVGRTLDELKRLGLDVAHLGADAVRTLQDVIANPEALLGDLDNLFGDVVGASLDLLDIVF